MSLDKIAVRRLTKLALFMRALPRSANGHFSMLAWLNHNGDDNHNFTGKIRAKDPLTCGTVVCAAGFAATVPEFRSAGLEIFYVADADNISDAEIGELNWNNFKNIMKFFRIDFREATELFGQNVPAATPKQWAEHCLRFVKLNK